MKTTNDIRIFKYKRGKSDFSCLVVINEPAGAVVFNDVVVPQNTPQEVKRYFLEEAEKAVLKVLEEE